MVRSQATIVLRRRSNPLGSARVKSQMDLPPFQAVRSTGRVQETTSRFPVEASIVCSAPPHQRVEESTRRSAMRLCNPCGGVAVQSYPRVPSMAGENREADAKRTGRKPRKSPWSRQRRQSYQNQGTINTHLESTESLRLPKESGRDGNEFA